MTTRRLPARPPAGPSVPRTHGCQRHSDCHGDQGHCEGWHALVSPPVWSLGAWEMGS